MIIKITPQIEEMARTLCGEKEKSCAKCDSFDLCEFWIEASILHNAGYRKQAWISVNERLPQVCGVYICCVKTKGGTTFTKTAEFVPEMKMWFGKFGEIKNIVTHWMPLPEPPKGVQT